MNPKLRNVLFTVAWVVGWYVASSLLVFYGAPFFFGKSVTIRQAFGFFFLPSTLAVVVLVLCILGWLPGTRRK
jgi:hypothetical protein